MALSKLKMVRMQRGFRQFDVARQVGISEPYMSKLETGRKMPKGDLLCRIAEIIGVTEDDLREDGQHA